jgi:tetratricopeptide (TPR) repeat protein
MEVSAADLKEVEALYDKGLYIRAYERSGRVGPLDEWTGTEARCMAARLAGNLGGMRRAAVMFLRTWRADPEHPRAIYHHAYTLMRLRGPLVTWEFVREHPELRTDDPVLRADWMIMKATLAGSLRDFHDAEKLLARAEELAADYPWLMVQRSFLRREEDRYEEALEAAREALVAQPWYRPGVRACAHALRLLDRHEEALELLVEADRNIESSWVAADVVELQLHLEKYAEAGAGLDRFVELSPLLDKDTSRWLAAMRSTVAYRLGRIEEAAEQAEKTGGEYYRALAANVRAAAPDSEREVLPVGFVRQHHVTCAPATLTVIARFWSMPAEHLEVAEEICYDGTSAYSERKWAEDNGWATREFDITWEEVVALIDRGVPFTITLVAPDGAHLQAVVGYDARKRTLVIRDPYVPNLIEPLAQKTFEELAATGPRGMALVPAGRRDLLDGLELGAAGLYDVLYEVSGALQSYDWKRAWAAYQRLEARAPGHHVTIHARRAIAAYDADNTAMLECAERLLALFPESPIARIARINCLYELGRREERLELLRAECRDRKSDPGFWWRYADDLRLDARSHAEAIKYARRALRARPTSGRVYHILADILWERREHELGLDLYRFAACLEDKDEHNAISYFRAARQVRKTEEVLDFLRARFVRFGRKSGGPAVTLFDALDELERVPQAIRTMERALKLRRDDGKLLLHAAMAHGRYGNNERAEDFLGRARGKAARSAWLQASAALAKYRGDSAAALEAWRKLLKIQPLNIGAHRSVSMLLAETKGSEGAVAHIAEAAERFPHNVALHALWVQWVRDGNPEEHERVARLLLGINPADAWGLRELCLALLKQNRGEEALAAAEEALGADPGNPFSQLFRGHALASLGRREESRAAMRRAIEISVDCEGAIDELLGSSASLEEVRGELELVRRELVRQTIYGDGLLAYRRHAVGIMDPEEVLGSLREAREARPDLWHAWSALTWQLMEMNRLDEAAANAEEACRRFPLLPRIWHDRARVHRASMDLLGEIAALERALEISPGWGRASTALADAYRRAERLADARKLMERSLRHDPLDPANHGELAEVLWDLGEREAAVERIKAAIKIAPEVDRAWSDLRGWTAELDRPGEALDFAREVAERRPRDAEVWLNLARCLEDAGDYENCVDAARRAIELEPQNLDARDLLAVIYAGHGNYFDALKTCKPEGFPEGQPVRLRARQAWVKARMGKLEKAVEEMRAVVAERPDYYWAWQQLADWFQTTEDKEGLRGAAEMMSQLAPHDPMTLVYVGEAKLAAGDRDGAKAEFLRAYELAPTYGYAGLSLLDMHMEDANYDAAEAVLVAMERAIGDEYVGMRRVQLEAKRGNSEVAFERFRSMCADSKAAAAMLDASLEALESVAARARISRELAELRERPDVNPHVAVMAARRLCAGREFAECRRQLKGMKSKPEQWRAAAGQYVESLAEAGHKIKLRWFISRHEKMLREDDTCWGQVGYALLNVDLFHRVVRWMHDWPRREGVRPWMLINLSGALRNLGREERARRVEEKAVSLPPDHCTPCHLVWLAVDEAAAGRPQKAQEHLGAVGGEELNPYYRMLKKLAEATLEVQVVAEHRRPAAYRRARAQLSAALNTLPEAAREKAVKRAVRRCVRRIAESRGGLAAKLWALGKIYLSFFG